MGVAPVLCAHLYKENGKISFKIANPHGWYNVIFTMGMKMTEAIKMVLKSFEYLQTHPADTMSISFLFLL